MTRLTSCQPSDAYPGRCGIKGRVLDFLSKVTRRSYFFCVHYFVNYLTLVALLIPGCFDVNRILAIIYFYIGDI